MQCKTEDLRQNFETGLKSYIEIRRFHFSPVYFIIYSNDQFLNIELQ